MHGVPEQIDKGAWSRMSVIENILQMQANAEQPPPQPMTARNIDQMINSLIASGLAADAALTGPQSIRFAETHRIRPRMLGLGNDPEKTGEYAIGYFGAPLITVSRILSDLWETAETYSTLWGACLSLARQEKNAGVTEPDLTDPNRLLLGFLSSVHRFLSVGAMYLEPAR
jgi:hypothetical protein